MMFQGRSKFYVLKNNCVLPKATGTAHWLEYLPGHMYCFLPSLEAENGTVKVYSYFPDIVRGFLFSVPIENIQKDKSPVQVQHGVRVGKNAKKEHTRQKKSQAESQHIAANEKEVKKAILYLFDA